MSKTGWEGLQKVRDRSGGPPGGQGLIEGHFQRSGMGRGTLPKVRDVSGTLPEVEDGSVDPSGCPGQVRDPIVGPGRVGGTSGGMGRVVRRFWRDSLGTP